MPASTTDPTAGMRGLEDASPPKLYWMAGCTGCLRMKEFVEHLGIEYSAVNIGTDPDGAAALHAMGGEVPAVAVGDRWVRGNDLAAVADLIGVDYEAPIILPATTLVERFERFMSTLVRLTWQADVAEHLEYRRPERDRSFLNLAYHAASVMLVFMQEYSPPPPGSDSYVMTFESPLPPGVTTAQHVEERAHETLSRFRDWWSEYGHDDPLDQVLETHFGYRTALEALERATWHTGQHVRQLAMFLEDCGVVPEDPLGPADIDGLPMPRRVFT